MKKEKVDIITFKVPESLREAMKGIPNRSEFIRAAVVAALNNICPFCKGTGVIMPHQRPHWDLFANNHHFEECGTCNAVHVVCDYDPQESAHPHGTD
ncbi:MAG: CopG family transcriptional regulator [Thermodesulfobacteriota bacterium]